MTFLLSLVLLVSHTLSLDKLKVDNTTIVLLLVLLICPFISAVKRIKYGDFEAEIDSKEVRRIKEDVEAEIDKQDESAPPPSPAVRGIMDAIATLAVDDPILALAKLRIEIEKVVSRIHVKVVEGKHKKGRVSLGRMISHLAHKELLPRDIAHGLQEVVSICNRAVHGEEIRRQDVDSIIDTGTDLLEILNVEMQTLALGNAPEATIIEPSTIADYDQGRYKLTTLVPLVENPVRNVYHLDHDGIEAFFEDYDRFAEFVIELRRVDENRG